MDTKTSTPPKGVYCNTACIEKGAMHEGDDTTCPGCGLNPYNAWRRSFFAALKARGLFVRDYDGKCFERLPDMAEGLHWEISAIGQGLEEWRELALREFRNAYAEARPGKRKFKDNSHAATDSTTPPS